MSDENLKYDMILEILTDLIYCEVSNSENKDIA